MMKLLPVPDKCARIADLLAMEPRATPKRAPAVPARYPLPAPMTLAQWKCKYSVGG